MQIRRHGWGAVQPRVPVTALLSSIRWLRTPKQTDMARIILAEFASAGLPTAIGLAAVVNAYHESKLDPCAVAGVPPWTRPCPSSPGPTGEDSVGLFQLYAQGHGSGMTTAARRDPHRNTQRIIDVVRSPQGHALRAAAAQDATVAELTELFCRDIERPAAMATSCPTRGQAAYDMLGPVAGMRVSELPDLRAPALLAVARVPLWAWIAGGVALAAAGIALLLWQR